MNESKLIQKRIVLIGFIAVVIIVGIFSGGWKSSILWISLLLACLGKKVQDLEEDNDTLRYTIYGISKKGKERNKNGGFINRIEKIENLLNKILQKS